MIQQQRAANLEKRLAQDEKNREFRQQQQQNIYDFDVSGLPQAYIEKIGELQNQMASWLDPKAEVHYENSQQLTRDIAKLNNLYMSGKRLAAGGQAAMKNYEDRMTGRVKTPGVSFSGNEETYKNRKDAYDQGGFGSMEIVGGPGDFNIMGVPLSEGENGMWGVAEGAEQVDILSAQIDPDALFRQEEIRDFINVEQKYVEASSAEMAEKQAESDFNSNPASVQAEFRAKLAAEDPRYLERNDDGEYKIGADELLVLYKEEAKSGWDKFHEVQLPTSLLGGSDVVTEYGAATKLTDPKTGKDRTVSLYTGGETRKVNHIGFRGQGENTEVFYVYQDPNDPTQYLEAVVPYNSAEGFSLINDAGAIGTIAQLVGNADLTLEELKDSVEEAPAASEEEAPAPASTEGTTPQEGGAPEATPEQQAEPTPDTIGEYRTALDEMATHTGLGIGFMQTRDQKLAAEIQNEPLATQIRRVEEEIASLEEEIKNTPSYRRGSSSFKNKQKALEKLKGLKEKQQGLDTQEVKNARIDEIEKQIASLREQEIENEALPVSRGTEKARTRDRINEQITQLQQEMESLDFFANRESSSAGPAIQGEGPGIAYSKPQPPQDLDLLEVGDSKAGSTKEQREIAFNEAVRMAEEAGHPYPEAVAAQWALESGYGKKKAANYNYFGIKSSDAMIKRLADAGIEATAGDPVATEEVIDGKRKTINDSFLSFKSPEDAFMAYLMFIDTTKKKGERRYGKALDESDTALDYLRGIRQAGYATAENYADSLNNVAKSFGIDLAEIERKPVGTASN